MEIAIRQMRKTDLPAVAELALLANPHAVKDQYVQHILATLEEDPSLSYVAICGETVVGYAQAETRDDKAVLEDIAVAKEYQAKGIGRMLLNRIMGALRRKGAERVLAEVHYKCASAVPFYYKHGFRITGFAQNYFGIGHDAMMLEPVL